jgi:hypothetical protein
VSFERLTADRFRADHDVLQALPAGLRQAVSSVDLQGLLSLSGALDIYSTTPVAAVLPDGRTESVPGPAAAAWDLHLDVEQASIDVGMPVEHVHGGIRLRGQSDGRGWQTLGDVAIDSAMCRGVQLTHVQGPLTMDAGGVRFGATAAVPGQACSTAACRRRHRARSRSPQRSAMPTSSGSPATSPAPRTGTAAVSSAAWR